LIFQEFEDHLYFKTQKEFTKMSLTKESICKEGFFNNFNISSRIIIEVHFDSIHVFKIEDYFIKPTLIGIVDFNFF
jgi:hypothetical protein